MGLAADVSLADLMTTRVATERWNVEYQTGRLWMKDPRLRRHHIGTHVLLTDADIQAFRPLKRPLTNKAFERGLSIKLGPHMRYSLKEAAYITHTSVRFIAEAARTGTLPTATLPNGQLFTTEADIRSLFVTTGGSTPSRFTPTTFPEITEHAALSLTA